LLGQMLSCASMDAQDNGIILAPEGSTLRETSKISKGTPRLRTTRPQAPALKNKNVEILKA